MKSETAEKIKIMGAIAATVGAVIALIALLIALIGLYDQHHVNNLVKESLNNERRINEDKRQITKVIDTEAKAVLDQNLREVMKIYIEDRDRLKAVVVDASKKERKEQWIGKKQIEQRYKWIFNNQKFIRLSHYGKRIEISDGNQATVIASTEGEYVQNGKKFYIRSVDGEQWALVKIDGKWKVTRFIYGLR